MKARRATPLAKIELLVLDVDGVLTDGRLYFSGSGEALKTFHVRDGHGIKLLMGSGVAVATLSGRRSPAATARMRELKVRNVVQGCADKVAALIDLTRRLDIDPLACACLVDDTPDLPLMAAVPARTLDYPDIIVIQHESIFDPRVFGLPVEPIVEAFLSPTNGLYGSLNVDIFGGGSWQSEFSLLIPTALTTDRSPRSGGDGGNAVVVVCEECPGVAGLVEDVVVTVEDGDREFVATQIFPDVFDRVEFGCVGRQRDQRDVVRNDEIFGDVITGAIEDEGSVAARRNPPADLRQMQGP